MIRNQPIQFGPLEEIRKMDSAVCMMPVVLALYPWWVIGRAVVGLSLLACIACTTASLHDRPDCAEEVMAEWQIPAAWYVRALAPAQAHEQVLTGNLGVDSIRERWQALHDRWREGDQYWRYKRPEERWINPLGWQEGVVLNRGCGQLGFVTTSMQPGEDAATHP